MFYKYTNYTRSFHKNPCVSHSVFRMAYSIENRFIPLATWRSILKIQIKSQNVIRKNDIPKYQYYLYLLLLATCILL